MQRDIIQYLYNAIITTYCYFCSTKCQLFVCLFLVCFLNNPKANKQKKIYTAGLCSVTVQFSVGRGGRDRQSLSPFIPPPTHGLCARQSVKRLNVVLYGKVWPLRNTATAPALCSTACKWRGDAVPPGCPLLAKRRTVLNFKEGVHTQRCLHWVSPDSVGSLQLWLLRLAALIEKKHKFSCLCFIR